MAQIEKFTSWKGLGVIPWFEEAPKLPAEDAMGLKAIVNSERNEFIVAVPQLSRIANFDDLDPLRMEPGVDLILVRPGEVIPVDADMILLPGTKSTIGDLMFLREQGWHIDIASHVRRGGSILGLCGGYQMLGKKISDPMGIESSEKEIDGLGFLDVETVLTSKKTLTSVRGKDTMFDTDISGYEIHIGKTSGFDCNRPITRLEEDGKVKFDGASSHDGRIMGSYIHGIFASNSFRRAFLNNLGLKNEKSIDFNWEVESTLDKLADHLEKYINVKSLFELAR
jgi:adenosylcobyric acid synthase